MRGKRSGWMIDPEMAQVLFHSAISSSFSVYTALSWPLQPASAKIMEDLPPLVDGL